MIKMEKEEFTKDTKQWLWIVGVFSFIAGIGVGSLLWLF